MVCGPILEGILPLKRAVLSDIHANQAAFEAVLADAGRQGVDDIYCLGDIIGYGPDPRACIDLARHNCAVNLLGNHEEAVLFGAIGFNPKAKVAIDWTRDQLSLAEEPQAENRELWNFIGSLAKQRKEGTFLYVHGSPRDPTREYIFKTDIKDERKMEAIYAAPPDFSWNVSFAGHTHHPGVFLASQPYSFFEPAEIEHRFEYSKVDHRVLVNVGSVGQPRDGDNRASYCIVDDEAVIFRRVSYDVRKTIDRFQLFPMLPDYLAKRLEEGK